MQLPSDWCSISVKSSCSLDTALECVLMLDLRCRTCNLSFSMLAFLCDLVAILVCFS